LKSKMAPKLAPKLESLTMEQLGDAVIRTVEQMTPAEKADLRKCLDAQFKDNFFLTNADRQFWRGLRPCPHSHHTTDEEFKQCLSKPN
jgi:hypothetical protein